MKNVIIIIVLLISNVSLAQIEKKSDTLEIWTIFSIGNFVKENAEKIIGKNWPFTIKGIAGDSFTEDLIDSVKIHNDRIWSYLDSNGYSNSKKKFESDLLAEIKRINKAVYTSNSDKILSELFEKLRKNKRRIYTELKKISDEKYEFTLYSFDLEDIDKEQIFETKFIADLNSQKIEIIE